MFVASGGHHGPGNGPASLVAAHPELKDGTLLILNLEHVAYADVVRGKTRAPNNIGMSWELSVTESGEGGRRDQRVAVPDRSLEAGGALLRRRHVSVGGPTVSGDLGGYRPLGVPMTQMIQSGTFYHSSGDVLRSRAGGRHRARGALPRVPDRAGRSGAGAADRRRQGHAVPVGAQGLPMTLGFQSSDFRVQTSGLLRRASSCFCRSAIQGAAQQPGVHLPQGDDAGARRRQARDGDLDADRRRAVRCRFCSAGRRTACRRAPPAPAEGSLKELATDGYIFVVQNLRGRFGSEGTFELSSQGRPREPEGDERNDRRLRLDRLAGEERAEQQRQGRHVRRLVRRPHLGDDAAAPASGAEGDLRAGVARRSVDERRRPSLRRAAGELRVRVRGLRAGGQEREHALQLRDLRHVFLVSRTSARSRTSTRSICTARFRTGTRSSSIPTTTRSGRTKRG